MNTTDYIKKHEQKFLDELFAFLRIPSVSTSEVHIGDTRAAAEFVADALRAVDVDNVQIFETALHPVVYGDIMIDRAKPTVLVYGHYDVQPPDPLELWKTGPFEPEIRDGNIYARGACDDKGQMYMHIKAIEVMRATGDIPVNIKFLFEGEEEMGSPNLESFVSTHKELLAADVVLISDTSLIANDIPSITAGLRGLSYIEVTVTGPDRDLHSGVYGGAVHNPLHVLADMISSLKDDKNRVTIPGFYDDVVELTEAERTKLQSVPFDERVYAEDLCVRSLATETGYSAFEATRIRPSLDINGIWGGYTEPGAKTVLPSRAAAKISMRLVPNQSSKKITTLITEYLQSIAPPSVTVEVHDHHGGEPCVVPTDSVEYQAAAKAMQQTFGVAPVPDRCGGSIPIVALFQEQLGIDSILMGFGLDSDNIHSPNEKFGVWNYMKGIETIPWFYTYYGEMK
jgi:acetylornithine deacetylase/succinyl-diaminopimelate desuccinylase-like protein